MKCVWFKSYMLAALTNGFGCHLHVESKNVGVVDAELLAGHCKLVSRAGVHHDRGQ